MSGTGGPPGAPEQVHHNRRAARGVGPLTAVQAYSKMRWCSDFLQGKSETEQGIDYLYRGRVQGSGARLRLVIIKDYG